MKAKLSLVMLGLLLIGVVDSCKKSSNNSNPSIGTTKSSTRHGFGAILDSAGYANAPEIDLDVVKANLISIGLLSKEKVNGPPPTSVILNYPAPANQGFDGTCTSFSAGYSLMGTLANEYPSINVSNPRSPYFLFQKDHSAPGGSCSANVGMTVLSAMNILQSNGVCSMAYDNALGSPCVPPSGAAINDAYWDMAFRYGKVTSVAQIKQAISMRFPVELAFKEFTSFTTAWDNHTTLTSLTGTTPDSHAICIIGYDDTKNAVLAENSWGYGGDLSHSGCIWIDYGLLTNSAFQAEMYVVTPLSSSKQPIFEFYQPTVYRHANSLNISIPYQFPGYIYNGQQFSAFATSVTGTVPIYQFYSNSSQDHVLTTNPNPGWTGYTNTGIVFYAYSNTTTTTGTIPIYEFYLNGDHYYTTNSSVSGWHYNGQPFRALPN